MCTCSPLVWFSKATIWPYGAMTMALTFTVKKMLCSLSRSSSSRPVHASLHADKRDMDRNEWTSKLWVFVCVFFSLCFITYTHTLLPPGRVSHHSVRKTGPWPQLYTHTVHSAGHIVAGQSPTHCRNTGNTVHQALRDYRSNPKNTCGGAAYNQQVVTYNGGQVRHGQTAAHSAL